MRLTVHHTTTYRFDRPMRHLVQSHRLTPSLFEGQKTLDWRIEVDGAITGAAHRDGAGDWVSSITHKGPLEMLSVSVAGTVETTDLAGVLRGHREMIDPRVYLQATRTTKPTVTIREMALDLGGDPADTLDLAHRMCEATGAAVAYVPGTTSSVTTSFEALSAGEGVCQDLAHVMISLALSRGLPARYVVGYLHSNADGSAEEASHAWAEVHVAGLGWVGFDPTNGCCPDAKYIRLGSGRDAQEAAPIRGQSEGISQEDMDVEVTVRQTSDGMLAGQNQAQ